MQNVWHILQALKYKNSFDHHSYLWLDDRHIFLKQFLTYGHQLSPEELEIIATTAANEEFPGLKEMPPTIEQFKEQVMYENWWFCTIECEDSFHLECDIV